MSGEPRRPLAAFFDLDGTLARNNQPPAAADREAIRAFRQEGNRVFLCTGRAPGFLYPAVLEIGFDGVVSGAGAHITLNGGVLYRRYCDKDIIQRVIRYGVETGTVCVLEGETGMFQVDIRHRLRLPWERIPDSAAFFVRHPDDVITKLTCFGPCDPALREALADLNVIVHPDYVEAVPAGCSKSDGMRRILEALGIPRENSLAFGDSMNDVDMLAYAGTGIVMGDAIEAVKASADRVTLPLEKNGVAAALAEWLKER